MDNVAKLTVNGIVHDIFNRENIIGRGDNCNIIINNEAVSSQHAIIEASECEEHILYDLGSTNKTKLGKVSNSPKHHGSTNFTIPETPEKCESSNLHSLEVSETKDDDDIINSSDIDIFDEEEICKHETDIKLSSIIRGKSRNHDAINLEADKKSEIHHAKSKANKIKEETSLKEIMETYSQENLRENETFEEGRLFDERESIYDIPTQTINEEGHLFEETSKTFEVEIQQDVMNSRNAEGRKRELVKTPDKSCEMNDQFDIEEADTLDPTEFEINSITVSEKTLPAVTKGCTRNVENQFSKIKQPGNYVDEDEFKFSGRKVNEINTQDMLCKSRDDSDDEAEEMKPLIVMDIQLPKEEREDIKYNVFGKEKVGLDSLHSKELPDNNGCINLTVKEDNISSEVRSKYQNEKVDKCAFELINKKDSCCGSQKNLSAKEDSEENVNYKEKKMKLSQMMKFSASGESKRDVTAFSMLGSNRLPELWSQPVVNKNVVTSNEENNLCFDKSTGPQTKITDFEDSSTFVNLTLSNMQFQPTESQKCLSTVVATPANFNETKRELESAVQEKQNSTSKSERLGDSDICNSMKQSVLISGDMCNKTEKGFFEKDKYKELFNQAEDVIHTKEEISKAGEIVSEATSDLKSLNDSDICNLLTQPILTVENINAKNVNKDIEKKKKITNLSNKVEGLIFEDREDVLIDRESDKNNLDIGDLKTQPVLTAEDPHEIEENKVCGKKSKFPALEMKNLSVKGENKIFRKEKAVELLSRSNDEFHKSAYEGDKNDKWILNDIDICDLETQSVVTTSKDQLAKKERKSWVQENELQSPFKTDIVSPQEENLETKETISLQGEECDQQTFNDTDICDVLTQPVSLVLENVIDKCENKIIKEQKTIESPGKPFYGFQVSGNEESKSGCQNISNDVDISDLETQSVVSSPENLLTKEGSKTCKKGIELQPSLKADVVSPQKEELEAKKTLPIQEKECDQESSCDIDICDVLTQPIAMTPKNLGDKGENKIYSTEKAIVSPDKPFYGFHKTANEKGDVSNILGLSKFESQKSETNKNRMQENALALTKENVDEEDDSCLLTQPVSIPHVESKDQQTLLGKEKIANYHCMDNKLTHLFPKKYNFSKVESVNNKSKNQILTSKERLIEEEDQLMCNTSMSDLSFSSMLTQPILPLNAKNEKDNEIKVTNSNTEAEGNKSAGFMVNLPSKDYSFKKSENSVKSVICDEIDQNLNDDSISDMLTQPVIVDDISHHKVKEALEGVVKCSQRKDTEQNSINKIEIAKEKFSHFDILSSVKENKNVNSSSIRPTVGQKIEHILSDSSSMFSGTLKKKFTKQVTATIDSNEGNEVDIIIPENRKNITLRLKKEKKIKSLESESVQKECLTECSKNSKGIEHDLTHLVTNSNNIQSGEQSENQRKLSKVNHVPIAMLEGRAEKRENDLTIENTSNSVEINSISCIVADNSSCKNNKGKSVTVPKTNNKSDKGVSKKKVPLNIVTSKINSDTNDASEEKKSQLEMGRGKRKRMKKIYKDFSTDGEAENLDSNHSEKNSQNKSAKVGELAGNYNNVENQKKSVAERNRKSKKNKQDEELKSKENISSHKKPCTREFDSSLTSVNEEGKFGINLKEISQELKNKKKKAEETGNYNQSKIKRNDSTITKTFTASLQTSDSERENLDSLECSFNLKNWNSPLNKSEMRTYSRKKSFTSVSGGHSISSSDQFNEWKNITIQGQKISKEIKVESSMPSNDSTLKRGLEQDSTEVPSKKKFKTKKVNNDARDKKKSVESQSEIRTAKQKALPVQLISPVIRLTRCHYSEKVCKNSTSNKEISSNSSRKANHSREVEESGGQIVDCPKSCTVLVTDKVRRTVKFLCAVALGRPIVSPQWLTSSKTSHTFLGWYIRLEVDHDKYLLKDKAAEQQFSFTLKESLAKARKTPLLRGKSIFVTNSVKPPPLDMQSIVECSGGKFLSKVPTHWPQDTVIISCNEDKSVYNKYRKKQQNIPIVSAEFILSGILQQDFNPDKTGANFEKL
uniref:Mediator of DNA damage checkpoint protein 1 n=1 Tax=Rhodnius prolixus TaxID=13249 RepID=T1I7S3_RHOPR